MNENRTPEQKRRVRRHITSARMNQLQRLNQTVATVEAKEKILKLYRGYMARQPDDVKITITVEGARDLQPLVVPFSPEALNAVLSTQEQEIETQLRALDDSFLEIYEQTEPEPEPEPKLEPEPEATETGK